MYNAAHWRYHFMWNARRH